jgi:NDP-sugar pyrophosphorylase family protein
MSDQTLKVVIPMAGLGTRLRPHTWSKPKPLVTVAGKPVLGHVLDMFETLPSIDEVVFIVGYLGTQVQVTLQDVAKGCERTIDFTRQDICETCHGNGAKPGTKRRTCSTPCGRR